MSLPQLTAKMSGIEQSKATEATATPTAKMSAASAKPTEVAQGASRFPKVVAPPVAPVRTAKIEAGMLHPALAERMAGWMRPATTAAGTRWPEMR